MSELVLCRTCGENNYSVNSKKLFEEENNDILERIQILTGIWLDEDKHMPMHICTCCHSDLYHSIAFRERCIRMEEFFQRSKLKTETTLDPFDTSDAVPIPREVSATLDPLNTSEIRKVATSESKNRLKPPIVKDHTEGEILDTLPAQQKFSPGRKLRCRTENPQTKKKISTKRKQSSRKISSIAVSDPEPMAPEGRQTRSLKTTLRSTRGKSKQSPRAPRKIVNKRRVQDDTLAWSEGDLEKYSAPTSPVEAAAEIMDNSTQYDEEPLPERSGNSTSNKETKKKREKSQVKQAPERKVYMCDLCGCEFSSNVNLKIHIMRHKGEKNWECEECGEKFYVKYKLQLHIRIKHKGEMPFECRYCGQRFYSGSERVRHEKVRHIRNFSYECKVCGKKYLTKSCLNKHEFLHTGQRPYRCDLCNVAFPRNPGLKTHLRTQQHLKRASEAINNQLTVIDEIMVPEGTVIIELDV